MKLTKTSRQKWMNDILSNEVKAPDFAKQTEEIWMELLAPAMPMGIAEAFKSQSARDWINPHKVAKLRQELQARIDTDDLSPRQRSIVAKLNQVEENRGKHQRTLDNIRSSLTTAAESVTTVAGLAKLLPQYAKYLPKTGGRPDEAATQGALFSLQENLAAVSKLPVKKPRNRKAVK